MKQQTQHTAANIKLFVTDNTLIRTISYITKDSPEKVVRYFWNMALDIIDVTYPPWIAKYQQCIRPMRPQYHKILRWHYIGTQLPYKLEIWARNDTPSGDTRAIDVWIWVTSPLERAEVDIRSMQAALVESAFRLDNSAPSITLKAPVTRIPTGFKKHLHP